MFGALKEHGPFLADLDMDGEPFVKHNPYTWAGNHSVLYVDNPVGTGFSFTDDPDDFPSFVEETTEVALFKQKLFSTCFEKLFLFQDLYNLLQQFYQLFPELVDNPFFAMGESYGGK